MSVLESKKAPDKHIISKLSVLMKASIKSILTKSCKASPFKFQWQNLIKNFLGPGLVSISPDSSSNIRFRLRA